MRGRREGARGQGKLEDKNGKWDWVGGIEAGTFFAGGWGLGAKRFQQLKCLITSTVLHFLPRPKVF